MSNELQNNESVKAVIGAAFCGAVIPLIEAANFSIRIIIFDWRWYPSELGSPVMQFNQAILKAARNGVHVKAMVNNDEVLATLKRNGVDASRIHSKKLLHTKMMVIDDDILIIGSHNYTQSAFSMNMEVSAICKLTAPINEFTNYFDNLWRSSRV